MPTGQQPPVRARALELRGSKRHRDRAERLGQRDVATPQPQRGLSIAPDRDRARSERADPCEGLAVEQQHAAREPVAKIDLVIAKQSS
jgi:hypothetical protein